MPERRPSNDLDYEEIALGCVRLGPTVAFAARWEGVYVKKKIREDRLRS
jgi:hypothetical protein